MDWLKHVSGGKKGRSHWRNRTGLLLERAGSRRFRSTGLCASFSWPREVKLPVIIHSRDAAQDTLDIMKAEKAGEIGGVIHCFSYGTEMAREYLNMGFYLGIGGVVTFNNVES